MDFVTTLLDHIHAAANLDSRVMELTVQVHYETLANLMLNNIHCLLFILQILTSAMKEQTIVILMLTVQIPLVAICVFVVLDTLEMERLVVS